MVDRDSPATPCVAVSLIDYRRILFSCQITAKHPSTLTKFQKLAAAMSWWQFCRCCTIDASIRLERMYRKCPCWLSSDRESRTLLESAIDRQRIVAVFPIGSSVKCSMFEPPSSPNLRREYWFVAWRWPRHSAHWATRRNSACFEHSCVDRAHTDRLRQQNCTNCAVHDEKCVDHWQESHRHGAPWARQVSRAKRYLRDSTLPWRQTNRRLSLAATRLSRPDQHPDSALECSDIWGSWQRQIDVAMALALTLALRAANLIAIDADTLGRSCRDGPLHRPASPLRCETDFRNVFHFDDRHLFLRHHRHRLHDADNAYRQYSLDCSPVATQSLECYWLHADATSLADAHRSHENQIRSETFEFYCSLVDRVWFHYRCYRNRTNQQLVQSYHGNRYSRSLFLVHGDGVIAASRHLAETHVASQTSSKCTYSIPTVICRERKRLRQKWFEQKNVDSLWSIARMVQNRLHCRVPQLKISIWQRRFIGWTEGRICEIWIQILSAKLKNKKWKAINIRTETVADDQTKWESKIIVKLPTLNNN